MSNATWACFECRETVRRPGYGRAAVLCPACGEPCRYLGHQIPIPPKRQEKAWRALLADLQQQAIAWAEAQQKARLQRLREIQAEIERLEAKGPNLGREKQVRLLRRKLTKL